ncbi:MAG: hypothetical protein JO170_06030 [Verrucomicrobia bacterium]|nr:hypothetical protein [Verrucomicrobiota bacterium]
MANPTDSATGRVDWQIAPYADFGPPQNDNIGSDFTGSPINVHLIGFFGDPITINIQLFSIHSNSARQGGTASGIEFSFRLFDSGWTIMHPLADEYDESLTFCAQLPNCRFRMRPDLCQAIPTHYSTLRTSST